MAPDLSSVFNKKKKSKKNLGLKLDSPALATSPVAALTKSDSKKEAQDSSSEWIVPDKPLVETTNNLGGGVLNDISSVPTPAKQSVKDEQAREMFHSVLTKQAKLVDESSKSPSESAPAVPEKSIFVPSVMRRQHERENATQEKSPNLNSEEAFPSLVRENSSTKASTPSDNVWTQHLSQGIEEEKKKQEEKELEEKKKQEEKEKEDMQKYSALLKPKKRRAQAK